MLKRSGHEKRRKRADALIVPPGPNTAPGTHQLETSVSPSRFPSNIFSIVNCLAAHTPPDTGTDNAPKTCRAAMARLARSEPRRRRTPERPPLLEAVVRRAREERQVSPRAVGQQPATTSRSAPDRKPVRSDQLKTFTVVDVSVSFCRSPPFASRKPAGRLRAVILAVPWPKRRSCKLPSVQLAAPAFPTDQQSALSCSTVDQDQAVESLRP
jgi:hypothetical protein